MPDPLLAVCSSENLFCENSSPFAFRYSCDPMSDIESSIRLGLSFLSARQSASGHFPSQVTHHYQENRILEDSAFFPTTQIIHSLLATGSPEAEPIISHGCRAIIHEMDCGGRWRFWNRDASRDGRDLHDFSPADLDDMACASAILSQCGIPYPDNKHLFLANRRRDGLFYTWVVPRVSSLLHPKVWLSLLREATLQRLLVIWKVSEASYNDVDGVVNANVLRYLGNTSASAPVIAWIKEIIVQGREAECDKWYRDPHTFYYAVAQCVRAGVDGFESIAPLACNKLLSMSRQDGCIGDNPLHTALSLCATAHLRQDALSSMRPSVDFLLSTQATDGGWESAPHFFGGPQKFVSWGSRELTTGFCLEALCGYLAKTSPAG